MAGIIVGVDGSGHSMRALEWAAREAATRHVPLTVVAVHQTIAGWRGTAVPYPGDQQATEQLRDEVKAETDKVLGEIGDPQPREVFIQAISGIPAEALMREAKEADMLVVGSRGAGGFSRLLLGSVTTQLTHHAQCPVVIIPPAEPR
jgi:nucleotide-binding universal stress UspA family protein